MAAPKQARDTFALLEGEPLELIPPGEYEFRFLYYETKQIFMHPKIFLWFSVITFGEHFEKRIPRYYGAIRLIGPKGKNRDFKVGRKSDFTREFCALFSIPVRRLDRLPMSRFENVSIVGRVRTVERAHHQRAIPPEARYSVIDELLRVQRP